MGGGQLTAVYSGGTGTTNTSTGTFTFAAGGALTFYYNDTPALGTDAYGTTSTSDYGASSGTPIGTFTQLAGGGGTVNPDGTPTSNGTVTATFQATTLLAGVWKNLGVDLLPTLTIGFITTNANEDNAANNPPSIDPNLVTALGGTIPNSPPNNFFVQNGGQYKLETTVPEPATIALIGLGLAGIGFGSKRRRAA